AGARAGAGAAGGCRPRGRAGGRGPRRGRGGRRGGAHIHVFDAAHGRLLDRGPRADRCRAPLPVPRARAGGRRDRAGGAVPVSAQVTTVSSEELARRIASVALDKKARDVIVLDMREVVSYTD